MRYEDFTVVWISALPLEHAAAKAMLDEIYSVQLPRRPYDHNIYTFGRVGRHNVALACLPNGTTGNSAATAVAEQALATFPALKISLLVGIGGGVPDMETKQEHDIRLGDVVVSTPTDTFGGVVQYDLGKTIRSGEFRRTGILNMPPPAIRTAVSELRSIHELQPSNISAIMDAAFEKFPHMKPKYSYPTNVEDHLYKAAYNHLLDQHPCTDCDRAQLVKRPRRESRQPIIHYGIVASGNMLMRDGMTRDKYADKYNVLCFEMEAAGLMTNFGCLVVRGICDYADSHKQKDFQRYAAAVAAAYTKELLSVVPPERVANEHIHPQAGVVNSTVAALPPAFSFWLLVDQLYCTTCSQLLEHEMGPVEMYTYVMSCGHTSYMHCIHFPGPLFSLRCKSCDLVQYTSSLNSRKIILGLVSTNHPGPSRKSLVHSPESQGESSRPKLEHPTTQTYSSYLSRLRSDAKLQGS